MKMQVELSRRESQVAEYLAWGASKKEIADLLFISERTVVNHVQNIYDKTGCSKASELSAWWFCSRFHISMKLSPLARQRIAAVILAIFMIGATNNIPYYQRIVSSRITCNSVRIHRNINESKTYVA